VPPGLSVGGETPHEPAAGTATGRNREEQGGTGRNRGHVSTINKEKTEIVESGDVTLFLL